MRSPARVIVVFAVVLAPFVAGVPARADEHVSMGGYERTYHVYAPARRSPSPPLIVVLHGGFGTGAGAEAAYGWDAVADRDGAVVLYPDGLKRAWNAGDCCGEPRARGVDDVAFIEAAIRATSRAYATDPKRLYVTGISNGGMMTYRLACESALPIAAIAPVAAALPVACEHPQRVSVLHVHGLADRNVPIEGGPGGGFVHLTYRPVATALAVFRKADDCAPPVTTTAGPVTTSRSACADGKIVQLTTVAGAGHQWPGSVPAPPRAAALLRLDPPSTALDATSLIWSFFASLPYGPALTASAQFDAAAVPANRASIQVCAAANASGSMPLCVAPGGARYVSVARFAQSSPRTRSVDAGATVVSAVPCSISNGTPNASAPGSFASAWRISGVKSASDLNAFAGGSPAQESGLIKPSTQRSVSCGCSGSAASLNRRSARIAGSIDA